MSAARPGRESVEFQYAGFGKRFISAFVDGLLFLPLLGLYFWLAPQSRIAAFILTPLLMLSYSVYSIYFLARYGQTLGKMAAGIRVLKTDGQPIGLREALLRSSVDVALGTLSCAGTLVAIASIPDDAYSRLSSSGNSFFDRTYAIDAQTPVWGQWAENLTVYWSWSELIVLLFNRKRRALHDFIAGTIVVVDQKPQMERFTHERSAPP